MHGVKDRIVLVTGAASGIGRATALAFAAEGARVVVVDRDAAGGEHTIAEIRNRGGHCLLIRADVSVAEEVESAVHHAAKAFGHIDFAINNAGVEGATGPVREYDEAEFDRVIATNLKSVWLCMKYEIGAMPDRGGAIINTSSISGLIGFAEEPAYAAAKAGIIGLTRSTAVELGKRNIRVNAICPGAIDTPMLHRSTSGDEIKEFIEDAPLRRLGKPDDIAQTIVWLCSDAASFITGVALPIDGGWTAQ